MSAQSVTVGNPRSASPTGRERRRSSRKPQVIEAFLTHPDGGKRVEVSGVNLSRHGVGFESTHRFMIGGFYLIEIGFGTQKLISEIRVISSRCLSADQFEIGAEFV